MPNEGISEVTSNEQVYNKYMDNKNSKIESKGVFSKENDRNKKYQKMEDIIN